MLGGKRTKQLMEAWLWEVVLLCSRNITDAKGLLDKAAITSKLKNSEILYQIGDAWFKPTTTDLKEAI